MATVKFDNATRIYPGNDTPSVDKLNIDIQDGEFLVLVGPSGCGKSTSLRMLAGLEEVNGGKIWIGDRDVTDMSPKDRDVAMVFQNYALYPHMTVADNMGFALKIAGVDKSEIRSRVDEVNKALRPTPFSPSGFLQIEVRDRSLPDVDRFLATLNAITSGSVMDAMAAGTAEERQAAEGRFVLMQELLARLGSADAADKAWRERCLDTRQHVQF